MACAIRSAFSEDSKYYSYYCEDGKLKIWETESGVLTQEYTPNLHLSTPCTCLTWIKLSRNLGTSKRKRKVTSAEGGGEIDVVVLGTVTGTILIYCVETGNVISQLQEGHGSAVNHLTWSRGCNIFSCGDEYIVEWSVGDKSIKSKWKAGQEKVLCVLVLPDGKTLLSASRTISWWNLADKQLLKSFTGHASDVISMIYVPTPSAKSDCYFVSAAKGDRYINAWSLNPKSRSKEQVASFVMEDIATCLSVYGGNEEDQTTMAAVTRSGILHIYRHRLNGKCQKPLKPKVTVQIASDAGQNKDVVLPIPIVGAHMSNSSTILIAHGNIVFLSFERISPKCQEKVLCLVRKDPRTTTVTNTEAVSKVRLPEAGDAVEYLSPAVISSTATKRGRKLKSEVPMEERLENLSLIKLDPSPRGPPRADNLAKLLIQGLHSKDRRILQNVLFHREDTVINNTVMRLPVQVIIPLVNELTTLIQGKTTVSTIATHWLKAVLEAHASQLLANPDIASTFSSILGLIETRLGLLVPLLRLRGRLDLLVDQIEAGASRGEASRDIEESLLVYQDTYSSDEGSVMDELGPNSDSDDRWEESDAQDDVDESEMQEDEIDDVNMAS